jgi:hypothetical protein
MIQSEENIRECTTGLSIVTYDISEFNMYFQLRGDPNILASFHSLAVEISFESILILWSSLAKRVIDHPRNSPRVSRNILRANAGEIECQRNREAEEKNATEPAADSDS